MNVTLPPLPYAKDALEPYVSGLTMEVHYEKHHRGYLEKLRQLLAGKPEENATLDHLARTSDGDVFDNAAQVWNHDFYWHSLTPTKTAPSAQLDSAITSAFGSRDELLVKLAEAGRDQFGSGWAWLVSKGGKLSIEKTSNAETPMAKGVNCLLTVDVWEHAYYLDYQNARPKYLESVLGKLLNWNFASANLTKEDKAVRAAAE